MDATVGFIIKIFSTTMQSLTDQFIMLQWGLTTG